LRPWATGNRGRLSSARSAAILGGGIRVRPRRHPHRRPGTGRTGATPALARDRWHHETPLHWAASNDDVGLIDALLDAGADIEHPGSSINGGPPTASALGYAQWKALRRLYERGAVMTLSRAAALGLMPLVTELATAAPPPDSEELTLALWHACRGGQLEAARYLAGRGADINWRAPWSGETPLDAARDRHQRAVVAWLTETGAGIR
jgi:uncharacterized protein